MKILRFLFLTLPLCILACYAAKMMPIEVLNNYQVLCKQIPGNEHIGQTIKDEAITLKGKVYNLPAGTIIDNRDFSGLIFPKVTYFPVGKNLIPFEKNEQVSILYDSAVYVMSGVLARDITLKVGSMEFPFKAARNDPESKKYRGEYQIRFHRNGVISEGYVSDKGFTTILGKNKIHIPGGSLINFAEDGTIEKIRLDSCILLRVGENKIPFRENMFFYPSGNIRSGDIYDTITIKVRDKNIKFCSEGGYYAFKDISDDGVLSFHENGVVSNGLLADTTSFKIFGKTIKFVPQGIFFDTTGNVQILAHGNEILKYKTDIPIMMFDNDYFEYDTVCPKLENGISLESLSRKVTAPFRVKIGGNNLLFSRNSSKYAGSERQIVPNQIVKIGVNTITIWSLAPVDGTGALFYPNGSIKGVVLKENCSLKVGNRSILFLKKKHKYESDKKEPDIMFYCDGKVARGFIGQEIDDSLNEMEPEFLLYKSKKVVLKPNQEVYFKKDGTVKYSINDLRYIIYEYKTDVYAPEERYSNNNNDTEKMKISVIDSGIDHSNCRRVVKVTCNSSQTIFMDGMPVGNAPVLVTNIPEGPHWFTINSWKEIAKELKKTDLDYKQAKTLIESYEKSSGMGGDTTAYATGEILPPFGYIRFNGPCKDTEQIHYSIDYKNSQMYYVYFKANIRQEIEKNKNPTDLSETGWYVLKDLGDTLIFAEFTEQAKKLLDKEGKFDEIVYANFALLLLLRNDIAGSIKLYENILKRSKRPAELKDDISKGLLIIEEICPDQEERIYNLRKKLGIFGKEQEAGY